MPANATAPARAVIRNEELIMDASSLTPTSLASSLLTSVARGYDEIAEFFPPCPGASGLSARHPDVVLFACVREADM